MNSQMDLVEGPSAWYARDLKDPDEWSYTLTSDDIAELDEQIDHWKEAPLDEVGRARTPLPRFGPVLRNLGHELDQGRGFFLIRGLPVERYSEQESSLAFWIIGNALGRPVSQNGTGELLGHVRNTGADIRKPTVRGYATKDRLYYHTDHADVVALLCLSPSKSGGLSTLASSVTVHNELVRRRPDLVPRLHEPFAFDYRGEQPPGTDRPYFTSPIYTIHEGRLSAYISKPFIHTAQRFVGVRKLTEHDEEALELMQEIAGEDGIRLDMDFQPGDMQFLSNYSILHSRTSFEDYEEPARRRHLLRLWLRQPEARPLPAGFGLGTRGTVSDGGIVPRAGTTAR